MFNYVYHVAHIFSTLSCNWKFVPFDYLQFPNPPITPTPHNPSLSLITINLIFFSEFACFWSVTDLQHCWFLVYNMIWYFYTFQNDQRRKCSYHLSPHKDITLLFTIFPTLYILSLCFIYFVTGSLYLLIFLTYCTNPPTHLPSGNYLFVLFLLSYVCLCFPFRFHI